MATEKMYYSMGEVAEMLCVSPSLVRFWEKRFDIIAPRKNKKGNRLFSPEDVRNLKTVYHLVKERGMTLAGAEKQLKARRSGIERDMEIAERLHSIRALLLEVRHELGGSENYELRITNYEANEESEVFTDGDPQVARSAGRNRSTEVITNYEANEESEVFTDGDNDNDDLQNVVVEQIVITEPKPAPEPKPEPEPEQKPKSTPIFIEQTLF